MGASNIILLLVTDLMLQSRIREQAKRLGYQTVVVESSEAAHAALAGGPALAFVDLQEDAIDWKETVAAARDRGVPVLAFGRHTDARLLRSAREAGCDRAVARSTLVEELPQLIEELVVSRA